MTCHQLKKRKYAFQKKVYKGRCYWQEIDIRRWLVLTSWMNMVVPRLRLRWNKEREVVGRGSSE